MKLAVVPLVAVLLVGGACKEAQPRPASAADPGVARLEKQVADLQARVWRLEGCTSALAGNLRSMSLGLGNGAQSC
jgi:hypothetical protein